MMSNYFFSGNMLPNYRYLFLYLLIVGQMACQNHNLLTKKILQQVTAFHSWVTAYFFTQFE